MGASKPTCGISIMRDDADKLDKLFPELDNRSKKMRLLIALASQGSFDTNKLNIVVL